MTGKELAIKAEKVAKEYKTLYVMGCFGAPMTSANKARYVNHHPYNAQPERRAMIEAASPDTFGFDCVNLIKALLWGWSGNKRATYGGAKYNAGYVGDVDADQLIQLCESSAEWSKIEPGCMVWIKGHAGLYIGEGLVVECTPNWNNGVQITSLNNIKKFPVLEHNRMWTKWGFIPGVSYKKNEHKDDVTEPVKPSSEYPAKGDIVQFSGGRHHATSYSASGYEVRGGPARVFNVNPGAPHPIALIHVDNTSNVYGWVDKETIK